MRALVQFFALFGTMGSAQSVTDCSAGLELGTPVRGDVV